MTGPEAMRPPKSFRGEIELRIAAVEARDGLRSRIVPNCRALAQRLEADPAGRRIVEAIEREAAYHAEALKSVLKARRGRR